MTTDRSAAIDQAGEEMRAALRALEDAMVADLARLEPSWWPWWIRRHFRKKARSERQRCRLGVRRTP